MTGFVDYFSKITLTAALYYLDLQRMTRVYLSEQGLPYFVVAVMY